MLHLLLLLLLLLDWLLLMLYWLLILLLMLKLWKLHRLRIRLLRAHTVHGWYRCHKLWTVQEMLRCHLDNASWRHLLIRLWCCIDVVHRRILVDRLLGGLSNLGLVHHLTAILEHHLLLRLHQYFPWTLLLLCFLWIQRLCPSNTPLNRLVPAAALMMLRARRSSNRGKH